MSTEWKEAQQWEQDWHLNNLKNTHHEEASQTDYLSYMGLECTRKGIDLHGKSVMDIGGGPISLLLRTYNHGKRTVVDPLKFPQWVLDRYKFCDIEFINCKGEDILDSGYNDNIPIPQADEVWIYNVLQHCENPKLIIENAKKIGKVLRIFEWIDVGIYDGHIHNLTKEDLDNWIGQEGNTSSFKWGDRDVLGYHGVFDLRAKPMRKSQPPSKRNPQIVFHMPGLAHTVTNDKWISCAFTQKVKKLSKMLTDMGHIVYHYGCESSDPVCTEHVDIVTLEEKEKYYPDFSGDQLWEYNVNDEFYQLYNERAAAAIYERCGDRDFLLLSWGWGNKPIENILRELIKGTKKNFEAVEPGVGYPDICTRFRAFESHAWRHYIYGKKGIDNGCMFDCVIPNYFDASQFSYNGNKKDYLLYLGRIVSRKGIDIASDVARRSGNTLVIAGQGTLKNKDEGLDIKGDHIIFAGFADVEKRKRLLADAKGLLMPTKYIEPFGGVSIEAQLSGTPVISTDFGAFCVPEETEIFTKRGWIKHNDVIVGKDETIGYNIETGNTEWTIIEACNVFANKKTLQYKNRNWEFRATQDHRWIGIHPIHSPNNPRTTITLTSLNNLQNSDDRILLSAPFVGGDSEITPTEASIIAWSLTDGSIHSKNPIIDKCETVDIEHIDPSRIGRIRLYQSKIIGIHIIERLLIDIPHTVSYRNGHGNIKDRKIFNIKASYARHIFEKSQIHKLGLQGFILSLTPVARNAFLQSCIDAEGCRASRTSTICINQNHGAVLDAMELCAYLCGYRPRMHTSKIHKGILNTNLSLCKPIITPLNLSILNGEIETVWCPSTKLGTWTARLGGSIVLTGNSENIIHGKTGYLCNTMEQFVWAANNIDKINPKDCRDWAYNNFTMDAVAPKFKEWFNMLYGLWGEGFYQEYSEPRQSLDLYKRNYI